MSNPLGGPISWMRRLVREWMSPHDANPDTLTAWLSGRGLPAIGDDEAPYVWILRGLPKGTDRSAAERIIAGAMASLLDAEIDRTTGSETDKLLYNFFMLAAGLSSPEELCEPLHRCLNRVSLAGRMWCGVPLVTALRAAIVENQIDARYEAVWRSMLGGEPHPYLGGLIPSGFDGVLWMPPSAAERGEPAVKVIGEALCSIAHYLDSDAELQTNRGVEFKTCLERARAAYPAKIRDFDLVNLAHATAWPRWAVSTLHTLVHIVGPTEQEGSDVVIMTPAHYATLLGNPPVVGVKCQGYMAEFRLSVDQAKAAQVALEPEEQARRERNLGPMMRIKESRPDETAKPPGSPAAISTTPFPKFETD